MILAIVTQPLVDVIEVYDQSIRIVAMVLTEGESKELLRGFVRETREDKSVNGVTICDPEVAGKGSDGLSVDGACAGTACLARGVCVAGFQRVESIVNLVWREMRLN